MSDDFAMKFVPNSKPIDLRSWIFFPREDRDVDKPGFMNIADALAAGFAAVVTEILHEQFERDPPRLYFPISYAAADEPEDGHGGPPPSDPVTLYVCLPLSEDEDACCYSCSLETVVDELLDGTNDQSICGKVADRLRQLADKIDAAAAKP